MSDYMWGYKIRPWSAESPRENLGWFKDTACPRFSTIHAVIIRSQNMNLIDTGFT